MKRELDTSRENSPLQRDAFYFSQFLNNTVVSYFGEKLCGTPGYVSPELAALWPVQKEHYKLMATIFDIVSQQGLQKNYELKSLQPNQKHIICCILPYIKTDAALNKLITNSILNYNPIPSSSIFSKYTKTFDNIAFFRKHSVFFDKDGNIAKDSVSLFLEKHSEEIKQFRQLVEANSVSNTQNNLFVLNDSPAKFQKVEPVVEKLAEDIKENLNITTPPSSPVKTIPGAPIKRAKPEGFVEQSPTKRMIQTCTEIKPFDPLTKKAAKLSL